MDSVPPASLEEQRAQLRTLIEQYPEAPGEREAWIENIIRQVTIPLETLREQNAHLVQLGTVLRDENERLRANLAGKKAISDHAVLQVEAFRTLADHSPDVILRFDRQLRHLYTNPAAAKMIGLPSEELIGCTVQEVSAYAPVLEHIGPFIQPFQTGQEARLEVPYPTASRTHWFDVRVVPEFYQPDGAGGPEEVGSILIIARDITHLKEIEDSLRRSQERFRVMANAARLLIFEQDRDLRYTWEYIPSQMTQQSVIGLVDADLFPTGEAALLTDLKQRVLQSGQGLRQEVRLTSAHGEMVFDLVLEPLRNPAGQMTGIIGAGLDITNRRLLMEANERSALELERQRALLQTIIETDPGGIAVIAGLECIVRMTNTSFRAFLSDPQIDPIGRPMEEIWPHGDHFQAAMLVGQVIEEGASLTLERQSTRLPDGSRRWFTLHARPINWEGQPAALIVVWETTEVEKAVAAAGEAAEMAHRRAEEAEEGRRLLEALMEFIPEGVTIVSMPDAGSRQAFVQYVSQYSAGLGHYQRKDLEGTDIQEYARLWKLQHPGGVPLLPEEFPSYRAAVLGEVIQDEEVLLQDEGGQVNLLINAGPIRDIEGRVSGSVATAPDITERKREEAHQRFLGELGRELVELRLPGQVQRVITERVGHHLGFDRCFIGEVDLVKGTHTIRFDYHGESDSLAGVYPLDYSSRDLMDRLEHGRPVAVANTAASPLTAPDYERIFLPGNIGSLVWFPWFGRDGRWSGMLIATYREPHAWRQDEFHLLQAVTDLARLGLENAHLLADLRDFRYRFEVALRNAPITVFTTDRELRTTWMFNPRAGLLGDNLLGKRPEESGLLENAIMLVALERSVLESGESARRELRIEWAGETTMHDVTVEPLFDGDGRVSGLTVATMETTELRRMQDEAVRNLTRIEVQRRLIAERELERTRIARDLHDGPLQELIASNFNLVEAMEINEKEERLAKMRVIQGMLQRQVQELRRFCNELRPPVLAPFGLEKTIRMHVEGLQELYPDLHIELILERDQRRLPEEVRMTLFRVYQELMNNVIRHSKASQVTVFFRLDEEDAVLEVEDNGAGFETPENWADLSRGGHLGLVGVTERVEIAGGRVEIESAPGQGTRVRVAVPR